MPVDFEATRESDNNIYMSHCYFSLFCLLPFSLCVEILCLSLERKSSEVWLCYFWEGFVWLAFGTFPSIETVIHGII